MHAADEQQDRKKCKTDSVPDMLQALQVEYHRQTDLLTEKNKFIQDLQGYYTKQMLRNSNLQTDFNELQQGKHLLEQQIATLTTEKDELKSKNASLLCRIAWLETENKQLKDPDHVALEEQRTLLQKDQQKLREEQRTLQTKIYTEVHKYVTQVMQATPAGEEYNSMHDIVKQAWNEWEKKFNENQGVHSGCTPACGDCRMS